MESVPTINAAPGKTESEIASIISCSTSEKSIDLSIFVEQEIMNEKIKRISKKFSFVFFIEIMFLLIDYKIIELRLYNIIVVIPSLTGNPGKVNYGFPIIAFGNDKYKK